MKNKFNRLQLFYFVIIFLLSSTYSGTVTASMSCRNLFYTSLQNPAELLSYGRLNSIEVTLTKNPDLFLASQEQSYNWILVLLERGKETRSVDSQKRILSIVLRIAEINANQHSSSVSDRTLSDQERTAQFMQKIIQNRSDARVRAINKAAALHGPFNPYARRYDAQSQTSSADWNTAIVKEILVAEPAVWGQMIKNPYAFRHYFP